MLVERPEARTWLAKAAGTPTRQSRGPRASHAGCLDTSCTLPTRAGLSETSDRSGELSLPEIAGQGSARGMQEGRAGSAWGPRIEQAQPLPPGRNFRENDRQELSEKV